MVKKMAFSQKGIFWPLFWGGGGGGVYVTQMFAGVISMLVFFKVRGKYVSTSCDSENVHENDVSPKADLLARFLLGGRGVFM